MIWAAKCLAVLLSVTPLAAGAQPADHREAFVDYLHVEANAGGSSGGHAAICFSDSCFHFQQGNDRQIRLHREPAWRLHHGYRALGNRTIHVYRVPVSAEARRGLLDAFEDFYRKQERDFERLKALQDDSRLLEHLGSAEKGADPRQGGVRVPGSAYFLSPRATAPGTSVDPAGAIASGAGRSRALERVAGRIRARYGPDCLETRGAALNDAARNVLANDPSSRATAVTDSAPVAGLSAQYRNSLSAWLAVTVLREAPPLRPTAVIVAPAPRVVLTQRDRDVIEGFQARLEEALVDLYGSTRSDWGYPMLVGLARVAAFEQALSRGQMVLLDVFREDAEALPASELAPHRRLLTEVLRERYEDMESEREAFLAEPSEMRWSRFETATNLAIELERALIEAQPLRIHDAAPLPQKSAVGYAWPRVNADPATLARLIPVAHARTLEVDDELDAAYGYDLLRRNCVTEILEKLDAIGVPQEARTALHTPEASDFAMRFARPFRFIPFVSAYLVHKRLGAVRDDRPSYRQVLLARMKAAGNPLVVQLRESNVLTSTIYARNAHDPLFLFFSDDAVLWRPLLGLANLTVTSAAAGAGAVLFPLDNGTSLRRAVTGVASSIPELFFVSLRKGSFPFVPLQWEREQEDEAL